MFTDNTGAPWPLAAPPYNGNPTGFAVNFIPESSVMTVQARRLYDRGNVTVYLKGLAATRAKAIIAYREENEPFAAIEDIMNVQGIKEGTFVKIKDEIVVG